MKELVQHIERELHGDDSYFSLDRAPQAMANGLDEVSGICADIAVELGAGLKNIYLVGAGGALANIVPLKLIFDRLLNVPVDAYASYALVGHQPARLGPQSLVFLASNTGETEDTLAALRYAKKQGARTVAVCARSDSSLVREASAAIAFAGWNDFTMLSVLLVGLHLGGAIADRALAAELQASLPTAAKALAQAVSTELPRGERLAREFLSATHLTVVASGVLTGLASKVAYNEIMENIRIGAAFIDSSEFRHGPCEALERSKLDMIFFVGTDWSRHETLRTLEACQRDGAHVLVYDAADYEELHPLLAPPIMDVASAPFIIYSAILRGIVSLRPRYCMGGQGLYVFEKDDNGEPRP
jgi:fructoselysine 6-phosphate deglycase